MTIEFSFTTPTGKETEFLEDFAIFHGWFRGHTLSAEVYARGVILDYLSSGIKNKRQIAAEHSAREQAKADNERDVILS